MSEKCFCHLNGYQVKDADARKRLDKIEDNSFVVRVTADANYRNVAADKTVAEIIDAHKNNKNIVFIVNLPDSTFVFTSIRVVITDLENNIGYFESSLTDFILYGNNKDNEEHLVFGQLLDELPKVTAADNGKVLRVVDGKWQSSRISVGPIHYNLILRCQSLSEIADVLPSDLFETLQNVDVLNVYIEEYRTEWETNYDDPENPQDVEVEYINGYYRVEGMYRSNVEFEDSNATILMRRLSFTALNPMCTIVFNENGHIEQFTMPEM